MTQKHRYIVVICLCFLMLLCSCNHSLKTDVDYKYATSQQKIDATLLKDEDMLTLSLFYFGESVTSSRRIHLDYIDELYKVAMLRKVENKNGDILLYNKYYDTQGNIIFLFSDEDFVPEFILDYYGTVIDYSEERIYYESFEKTFNEYRDLIFDVDL